MPSQCSTGVRVSLNSPVLLAMLLCGSVVFEDTSCFLRFQSETKRNTIFWLRIFGGPPTKHIHTRTHNRLGKFGRYSPAGLPEWGVIPGRNQHRSAPVNCSGTWSRWSDVFLQQGIGSVFRTKIPGWHVSPKLLGNLTFCLGNLTTLKPERRREKSQKRSFLMQLIPPKKKQRV